MPQPDTSTVGAPCWAEIYTSDQARARTFYGELFGWESTEPDAEFGGYLTFTMDGKAVAGCMQSTPEAGGAADVWALYLRSKDVQATTDAVAARGGTVLYPPMPVGELGTMAVFTDPQGAPISAWQPQMHQGFGVVAEFRAPAWFELHTRNYEDAVTFYREAFGWETETVSDVPGFRYTVAKSGEEQIAGVMDASDFLPEGAPAQWSIYFAVEDIHATIAKAVELGATVLEPAEDTPYGLLARLADPSGSQFKLQSPSPEAPEA